MVPELSGLLKEVEHKVGALEVLQWLVGSCGGRRGELVHILTLLLPHLVAAPHSVSLVKPEEHDEGSKGRTKA